MPPPKKPVYRRPLFLCTYQFKAGKGGGGRAWGGDLIVVVGPGVGLLTDLAFPGRGYLNLSSPNVGILNIDLNEETETEITFPASRMRYMSLTS